MSTFQKNKKLDFIALLVADYPWSNSTPRKNHPLCDAMTYEWLKLNILVVFTTKTREGGGGWGGQLLTILWIVNLGAANY